MGRIFLIYVASHKRGGASTPALCCIVIVTCTGMERSTLCTRIAGQKKKQNKII